LAIDQVSWRYLFVGLMMSPSTGGIDGRLIRRPAFQPIE
jgi:hypothetical protein